MHSSKFAVLAMLVLATTAAFAVALASAASTPVSADRTAAGDAKQKTSGVYIVGLAEQPAVSYEGGIDGYEATAPAKGKKLNPKSAAVKKYVAYLDARHDDVLAKVGGGTKVYDYRYAFNGFAAKLSPGQAAKLEKLDGVVSVEADGLAQPDTSTTPAFLELTGPTGLWSKLGGVGSAGEDVVVGIIDSGIWPEHPSFSDQNDFAFRPGESGKRTTVYGAPPAGWNGECQSGERWSQDHCNNKLIGARYFLNGFGHFGIIQGDYKSARDHDSHGTHTASTAAGNANVPSTGPAAAMGAISGMAPRARVAAYKVCWNGDLGGCANSDSVAAIDTAIADGVDVLNFSISGTRTSFLASVEVAFMRAARAGVFVATSAGNSGPGASTVAHPSPWLTTVGASTHPRAGTSTVTLGNAASYSGASVANAVPSKSLVDSSNVGLSGANQSEVDLCYPGTLDPAKVTGKIVLCDRGVIARVDKSRAVQQAGGVGMILANTSPSSLNADFHVVPTVHVNEVAGAAITAYIASAGSSATASIAQATISNTAPAPFMASFSSRGPSLATEDQLKPDVTAPGVDVLAGVSPDSNGRLMDLLSGTSMSSPHVAGLGALLKDAHPGWTPAMIKSALMTTGYDVLGTFSGANRAFAQGAGHVAPNKAVDPGLVYANGFDDWRGFLRSLRLCTLCFGSSPAPVFDTSDLNLASIAIGDLAGEQTVTRTVTNVSSGSSTYTASVTGLAGIDVTVTPSVFTIAPGATQTYTVKFRRTDAPFNQYRSGHLTWTDGTHTVRSPLVVRPVAVTAPPSVSGTGTSGSRSFTLQAGYTGQLVTTARGLVPAATQNDTVADDPTNTFVVGGPGVTTHTFTTPADVTYLRFSLFDAHTSGLGNDDIDLYVYKGSSLVGESTSGTSNEEVNVTGANLSPNTTYTVYVHGWQTASSTSNYTLFTWALGSSSAGNLSATHPSSVTLGASFPASIDWTGLTAGAKYLGAIDWSDGSARVATTLVRVDA